MEMIHFLVHPAEGSVTQQSPLWIPNQYAAPSPSLPPFIPDTLRLLSYKLRYEMRD
jgi:hypothetical protein